MLHQIRKYVEQKVWLKKKLQVLWRNYTHHLWPTQMLMKIWKLKSYNKVKTKQTLNLHQKCNYKINCEYSWCCSGTIVLNLHIGKKQGTCCVDKFQHLPIKKQTLSHIERCGKLLFDCLLPPIHVKRKWSKRCRNFPFLRGGWGIG